jgi:hypothetical protein
MNGLFTLSGNTNKRKKPKKNLIRKTAKRTVKVKVETPIL